MLFRLKRPVTISGATWPFIWAFIIELLGARWGHSQALRADAFNNLSGIFSTGLLMTGLFIASRTHDDDLFGAPIAPAEQQQLGPRIQQSRFRFETIFNLLAGTIMAAIGIDIIIKGVMTFATRTPFKNLSSIAGLAAGFSFVVLLVLWAFNHYWSRKLNNAALTAASRDTFTDALTSLTTVLTILVTVKLHLQWFDNLISIGLGLYILNTGTKIFRESSLNLVDYFDPYLEDRYQRRIADLTSVRKVIFLKAHYDGNLIMLRATIGVPPRMTAIEITRLIETINQIMWQEFGVMETDVMITTSY
ncbi:cation diffusion facilitator family transporter [Lactiplantibacillus plantarum]|uniref:cation diffusion facilitator family transporter n=1 Tax=Lactiplantibacillus plantarum TaxID=1590 RepID=UPI0020A7A29D|nr:cation transporter [Lactiplantibacillus plantarum]